MRTTSLGIWILGAGLLLGAGTARAADVSGDTGGPAAPEATAAVKQATADAVFFGAPAQSAEAWAGDTGGAPPPSAQERRAAVAAKGDVAAPAGTRVAGASQVQFTDRG